MGLFRRIRNLLTRRPAHARADIEEWFAVNFDDEHVVLSASPSGGESWKQQFSWSTVIRVCFIAEGYDLSHEVHVFTNTREESYVIPIEAKGGNDFWDEILRRNLFDAELAIKAASATTGEVLCWPPIDQ